MSYFSSISTPPWNQCCSLICWVHTRISRNQQGDIIRARHYTNEQIVFDNIGIITDKAWSDLGSKSNFSPGGKFCFSMCSSCKFSKFSNPSTTVIEFEPRYLKANHQCSFVHNYLCSLMLVYVIKAKIVESRLVYVEKNAVQNVMESECLHTDGLYYLILTTLSIFWVCLVLLSLLFHSSEGTSA